MSAVSEGGSGVNTSGEGASIDGTSLDGASQPGRADRPVRRWVSVSVAILFGLFFAYDLFEAITNLVGVADTIAAINAVRAENGLALAAVPWAVLWVNVALPPVAFALAWMMGRRRPVLQQAALFVVALASVAAGTLSLTALVS